MIMYTEKDLQEYGVAYYVFANVLADARQGNQLTIPQIITFRDQILSVEAEVGYVTRVILKDFVTSKVVAELKSPEELLKLFKMLSNGN